MLRLERVSKIYPTGEVLRDVTWEVKPGDRIGLVGVNGAGKSTQMRIIAGMEEPSSGQVVKQGDPRIVYLQQEFDVDVRRTVRQELFQAFGEAATVLNRQREVEEEMSSEKAAEDPDHLNELIHELGNLQTRFESLHGYELDARIDKLLPTIGFSPEGAEQLVGDYSGGWQMRIALGKVLLQEPDLLLLDEPTNHLDVETIQWLEDYLVGQTCPLVVISHDRAFLDRVCNQIVETERGISRSYLGNYSQHLEQKALEREAIEERAGVEGGVVEVEAEADAVVGLVDGGDEAVLEALHIVEGLAVIIGEVFAVLGAADESLAHPGEGLEREYGGAAEGVHVVAEALPVDAGGVDVGPAVNVEADRAAEEVVVAEAVLVLVVVGEFEP